MAAENEFDRLLERLRRGDEQAAAEVFHRFARRLIALARNQLDSRIRTRVEPEDVVQSVFRSFFTRFDSGQFQLGDWDSLWTVLAVITVRKCANRREFWHAAKRDLQRETEAARQGDPLQKALARDPTPAEAAILSEVVEQLMKHVAERDRAILTLHLQGCDIAAISEQVGRTERTVRRTLERVRQTLMNLQSEAEESPKKGVGPE
jgi:RNA polymerase sigma-70 factor (ECF subfamily)